MNFSIEETSLRIHRALEGIDGPLFTSIMETILPKIPGWVAAHMRMEHSRPSPSTILRCRYQQWCDGKGLAPDQEIPVGWKLRRMMGIVSEPLWLAILKLAEYSVKLPEHTYGCGPSMRAHPDAVFQERGLDAAVVELKSVGGVGYKKLINGGGVSFTEPDHFAQLQLYMHATRTEAGLYLATTPDPGLLQSEMRSKKKYGPDYELDPFYVEWVPYDPSTVKSLLERAEMINADLKKDEPPMREYDGIPTSLRTGRLKMPCGYCVHLDKCNDQFQYGEGELGEEGIEWDE